tara:strand:- start:4825 stop:5976 length:1152 start_codon:yes stop_codon:yes gene_type:complete
MSKKKMTIYGAIAAAIVAVSFAAPALADTPSVEELQARLDAAEARIAQLDASREPTWLETRRSEETKALVKDILADADYRTMMQGNGSPVTVNVHGFVQSRYTYSGGGNDEAQHGFSVPRARLILSGDLFDWEYKVSGQWTDGGDFTLKDAYAQGGLLGGVFRVGQFKAPFMREVLVSQVDTLMAERSIISNTFGQGRSQGVQYSRDFGMVDIAAAYTDGFNTANGAGVQNGQAFTARAGIDVLDWWNVGAAISYNDLVDTDYTTYTVDTKISLSGLDLTGAYVATSGDAGDNWGATVQAGYMVFDDLQAYVGYEYGELENVDENLSTLTVGANYWFNDNVKWTTDFGYALNGINSAWDLGETGWRSGDSGEYLVRTQIQVSF